MAGDAGKMRPETAAIHVPVARRDGSVAPPIQLSTTFVHGPAYEKISGFDYIRESNPNVDDLELRLAALEGGEANASVTFGSGMAAGMALLDSLSAGAKVLFHDNLYYGFRKLAVGLTEKGRLRATFANFRDSGALEKALEDQPDLVWCETPTNPMLEIIDLAGLAKAAHAVGAKLAVDGTFATPALQRPFDHGADYVIHSLTKYMGGHSDVMGGALNCRTAAEAAEFRHSRTHGGAVLAPFNAWLVSRGLQTLFVRMERHSANAAALAGALAGHSKLETVAYPFLTGSPDLEIARRQMRLGGGMVSIIAKGGREAALGIASRVRLFTNATSVGGVESLIEHRASVEGPNALSPQGLLRISVGLEHSDDLIADLMQAIDGA